VGITRFQLPTRSAVAAERTLLRRVPGAEHGAPTLEVVEAVAAVKCYFEGEETDFSGFKLDLDERDPFFKRIYAAARRVGWGHTTTYGTLAKELGAGPEAARDVGQAVARNPVALIIPCHRAFREISLAPELAPDVVTRRGTERDCLDVERIGNPEKTSRLDTGRDGSKRRIALYKTAALRATPDDLPR
jgi:O-6-methylguanine DNA methyltransferase